MKTLDFLFIVLGVFSLGFTVGWKMCERWVERLANKALEKMNEEDR